MQHICLDCSKLEDKTQLHKALAEALDFPDWYGHNLDALYDCLSELDGPVHLHLVGWQQLPDWKAAFAAVFDDAENDFMQFTVSYE